MFDNYLFYPFAVTVEFVKSKESIHPRISDVVAMRVLVKVGVFDFIVKRLPKNLMVLCESYQDWF